MKQKSCDAQRTASTWKIEIMYKDVHPSWFNEKFSILRANHEAVNE